MIIQISQNELLEIIQQHIVEKVAREGLTLMAIDLGRDLNGRATATVHVGLAGLTEPDPTAQPDRMVLNVMPKDLDAEVVAKAIRSVTGGPPSEPVQAQAVAGDREHVGGGPVPLQSFESQELAGEGHDAAVIIDDPPKPDEARCWGCDGTGLKNSGENCANCDGSGIVSRYPDSDEVPK